MIIYNTTFFHTAATAEPLKRWLREVWTPLCREHGAQPPLCLCMDSPQPGVEVLAVQAYFVDLAQCQIFASEVAPAEFSKITARLGADGVTPFPSILREVTL